MLESFNLQIFLLLAWASFWFGSVCVSAEVVPFLELGFFFDYDIPGQPIRIPTTAQCETIHLEWSRGTATGPNPVAPYFMQIYTSTFITPFTIQAGDGSRNEFDFQVPFAPGTRYQICMYDSKGTPGGCQETYTMIPNTTVANPSCTNVTFPPLLGIEGTTTSPPGPISQFGFPDQCSDITIKPLNGTPPFILTVSPPLHPPFNITSNTMEPITWTVSLGGEIPFFMSLVSSDGLAWSNGPMHAGLNGPTGCLAPGTISSSKAHSIAAGAGVGGLFGGLFLAAATYLAWNFYQKRSQASGKHALVDPFKDPGPSMLGSVPPPTMGMDIGAPMGLGRSRSGSLGTNASSLTGTSVSGSIGTRPYSSQPQQVYVMHRDGGSVPTPGPSPRVVRASDIVELPPRYMKAG